MGYYVIAQFNSGLPPDEQEGSYYQMDEREMEREEVRRKRWESDQHYQDRVRRLRGY